MHFIYAPHAVCALEQLNHFNDFRMRTIQSIPKHWTDKVFCIFTCFFQLDLKRIKTEQQQQQIYYIKKVEWTVVHLYENRKKNQQ